MHSGKHYAESEASLLVPGGNHRAAAPATPWVPGEKFCLNTCTKVSRNYRPTPATGLLVPHSPAIGLACLLAGGPPVLSHGAYVSASALAQARDGVYSNSRYLFLCFCSLRPGTVSVMTGGPALPPTTRPAWCCVTSAPTVTTAGSGNHQGRPLGSLRSPRGWGRSPFSRA